MRVPLVEWKFEDSKVQVYYGYLRDLREDYTPGTTAWTAIQTCIDILSANFECKPVKKATKS